MNRSFKEQMIKLKNELADLKLAEKNHEEELKKLRSEKSLTLEITKVSDETLQKLILSERKISSLQNELEKLDKLLKQSASKEEFMAISFGKVQAEINEYTTVW